MTISPLFFVVTEQQKFYGAINLKELIIARQDDLLENLVVTSYPYVYAERILMNVSKN